MLSHLAVVRDKVLDRAAFSAGEILLDVGCGEGLIGFGALERGARHVVFSDISQNLLDFCGETADALGLSDRCSFVKVSAHKFAGCGRSEEREEFAEHLRPFGVPRGRQAVSSRPACHEAHSFA